MSTVVAIKTTGNSNILTFTQAIAADVDGFSPGDKKIVITGNNGDEIVINGSGFKFDSNGNIIDGQIEKINLFDNGSPYASAFGFSIDAVAAIGFLLAGDIDSFLELLGPITFNGNSGNDVGYGANLGDTLNGLAGNDTLYGGDGDDTIEGGTGADTLRGQNGAHDTLSYENSSAGVTIALASGVGIGGDAAGDVFSGFENILGSAHNDTLTGNGLANEINGGLGNDIIKGGAGGDDLNGGGGTGDTLSYVGSAFGVTIDLAAGTASGGDAAGDTFTGFENVEGSVKNDSLSGDGQNNALSGGGGNDLIRGLAGADTLNGGGGAGDTLSYIGSDAGVTVNIDANTASGGHAAGDVISGFENVEGSSLNDRITGNAQANTLNGNGGNDTVDGGSKNDTVNGGTGNDRLIGGTGIDTMSGEGGSDTFVLNKLTTNRDIIVDFASGKDKFEISAASFGGGLVGGIDLTSDQFEENNSGDASGADVRFIYNSTNGELYYDANGDVNGSTDAQLIADLSGEPTLKFTDFDIV